MDFLSKILLSIIKDNKRRKRWRVFTSALAGVIVFSTSYMLILPAITMTTAVADDEPGVYLEEEIYEDADLDEYFEDIDWYDEIGDDYEDDDDSEFDEDFEGLFDDDELTEDEWDGAAFEEEPDADAWTDETDGADVDAEDSADGTAVTDDAGVISETDEYEYFNNATYTITELTASIVAAQDESQNVDVRLTFDASAMIADGTELTAEEIQKDAVGDAERYAGYADAVSEAVFRNESGWSFLDARFFDLRLLGADGTEVEPCGNVTVELTFAAPIYAERLQVVHFDERDGAALPIALEDIDIDSYEDGGVYRVSFETGSLYVFGVVTGAMTEAEQINEDENSSENNSVVEESEVDSIVESVVEEVAETKEDSIVESVVEEVAETEADSVVESVVEEVAEEVAETEAGSVVEPVVEEVAETEVDSIVESVVEEVAETEADSVVESVVEEMADYEEQKSPTTKAADAQIRKTVISASGETWEITVTYSDAAGVPEGADLEVSELTEGVSAYGMSYEEYVAYTENALGMDEGSAEYIRLFDIRIVSGGEKVEIAAPVSVKIELTDHDEEPENTQVIHFAGEAQEPEIIENVDVARSEEEGIDLTFETNGFSLYAILSSKSESTEDVAGKTGKTNTADVEVYSGHNLVLNTKIAVIESVGTRVTLLDYESGSLNLSSWYQITYEADGETITGYVETKYIDIVETSAAETESDAFKAAAAYENGVLPEGTTLNVGESSLSEQEQAALKNQALERLESVTGRGMKVTGIYFLDLAFVADNAEVEPNGEVSVSLQLKQTVPAEENENLYLVHFADDGAEILEGAVFTQDENSSITALDFTVGSFSTFAIVRTIEKYILASDGHNYKVSVTYFDDASIPEGADLDVSEIMEGDSVYGMRYEEYVSNTENAFGMAEGSAEYIRLFDIKIVDEGGEKVEIAAPVEVKIELADKENGSENTRVVHFADGAEEPDVLENVEFAEAEEEGIALTFETEGFSVYAIVDAPEPVSTEVQIVRTLEELFANTDSGFVLADKAGTEYFTNTVKNNSVYVVTTVAANASTWYIEPVDEGSYQCRIYTYINGTKQYMKQKASGGIDMYLADEGTVFEVSLAADGLFYFKHASENLWLQYSGSGGGIRLYKDHNNASNSRITISYSASYTVPDDLYELDGKTYGIAYHDDNVTAAALTAAGRTVGNQARLDALDMVMRPDVLDNDGVLLVAENSNIQEMTFHSEGEDKYSITTTVDGVTKYLTLNGANLSLAEEKDETYSVFTAAPGTGEYGGKWHFTVNGYSLNLPNGSANGFNGASGSGATTWMNLVEESVLTEDDFTTYTAKKVSVSDQTNVYNGQQVIIYTRLWNDTTKKYEFYAVDHDGSLIRCYDTGDNIEWVGSDVNTALWNFTVYYGSDGTENYYYELQNTQYGNYIAPQVTGAQIFSDSTIGVNLNGRRYGEAYTTIIAWDDDNYSYAGLKVENGRVVSCSLSEAEDFYFAIVTTRDEAEPLTTVATIDNNDYGITMKMFDFNNLVSNGRDSGQQAFMGAVNGKGLLSTNLGDDGYPTGTSKVGTEGQGQSFGNLISRYSDGETTVNQLFIQSIYNESGYFQYDSTQNYATLVQADGTVGSTFTVYDQIGAFNGDNSGGTRQHGQFMPYNDISQEKGYAVKSNGDTLTNQTDVLANELPDTDPRKGEPLYLIGSTGSIYSSNNQSGESDYFFGMEMEASFTQTASGLDAWGHDIIFEFSGDDDFWLYVDGELVIDLGGVHAAQVGTVNFRTGVITSSNGNSTLYETFKANYTARGMSSQEIAAKLAEIFTLNDEGSYVFKDYTNHTMKMFYMERGAGASNLKMRFNLAAVRPGTFILSKELSGTDEAANDLIEFPYQIWYEDKGTGNWTTLSDASLVHYQDTTREVKFQSSFTPAGGSTAYENVFFLKPGESAEVELPSDAVDNKYYVVECGVNPDVYDHVYVNDSELTGTATSNTVGTTARKDYKSSEDTTDNRKAVKYTNNVADGAMRTMTFQKKLYDADGKTELHYDPAKTAEKYDNTTFSFRLYLANENVSEREFAGENKSSYYANLYTYYIKDESGNYCKWDASSQTFVSLDVTAYEDFQNLDDDVIESATFTTSMHGSISKIPAWYSVEVRGLIAGTHYMVEERDWEIPKGYTRWNTEVNYGYARVDTEPDIEQNDPYYGTTAVGETPKLEIRNQRGWGLTVEKVWSDKDFMSQHDDIYFAVYLDGSLYPGTVRRLASSETEIYYYFDDLYGFTEEDLANKKTYDFSKYVVKEVMLDLRDGVMLEIDSDTGEVKAKSNELTYTISDNTYVIVTPVEANGTLTVGGTPVGGEHQEEYKYTAAYKTGDTTGYNNNVRVDTVTNSRPGIQIEKTNWDGTQYLSGAVFTLKDAEGNDVAAASYTSNSDGLVTIAYLNPGTYTLAETKTPSGYVKMDGEITITVSKDENGQDVFEISGPQGYYTYTAASGSDMAGMIVKNRTVQELKVVKVDAADSSVISGVHFALYRQVKASGGTYRRDYLPIEGYEDLVTGSDGVVPNVTMDLGAGTYYLSEVAAASGYKKLEEDLCFTIGEDGTVTIHTEAYSGWLKTDTSQDGIVAYEIEVQNTPLGITFRKTDENGRPLTGSKFTLSSLASDSTAWTLVDQYNLVSGEIDLSDAAELTVTNVQDGRYRLTETAAPTGYIILTKHIYFTVADGKAALTDEDGETASYDQVSLADDGTTIVVVNTPGAALPSTGGTGTHLFTILGLLLTAGAGILLAMRRRRAAYR